MTAASLFRDTYVDSVVQLRAPVRCTASTASTGPPPRWRPRPTWPRCRRGLRPPTVTGAGANDLFLAVRAATDDDAAARVEAGESDVTLRRAEPARPVAPTPAHAARGSRAQPGTNVAVISVPGDYAALEAHKALSAGLHVLLFSDNVRSRTRWSSRTARWTWPADDGTGRGHRDARRRRPRFRQRRPARTGRRRRRGRHRRAGGDEPARPLGGRRRQRDRARRARSVGQGRRAGWPAGGRARSRDDPATRSILLVSKPPAGGSPARWSPPRATAVRAALVGLDAGFDRPARRRPSPDARGRCARDAASCSACTRPTRRRRTGHGREGAPSGSPATTHAGPRPVLRRHALLRGAGHPRRDWDRCYSNTPLDKRSACRRRPAATSAWTSVRRSTRRVGRTR